MYMYILYVHVLYMCLSSSEVAGGGRSGCGSSWTERYISSVSALHSVFLYPHIAQCVSLYCTVSLSLSIHTLRSVSLYPHIVQCLYGISIHIMHSVSSHCVYMYMYIVHVHVFTLQSIYNNSHICSIYIHIAHTCTCTCIILYIHVSMEYGPQWHTLND